MSAYLLVISTQAPYHASAANDAFEAALAATNVGLEVKFLFQHDGVYQLLAEQQPETLTHKSIYKKLKSLPLFDIEDIYADQESVDIRGVRITNDAIHWHSASKNEVIALVRSAHHILVF